MANYERVPLPLFNSISHLDLGRYFDENYQMRVDDLSGVETPTEHLKDS